MKITAPPKKRQAPLNLSLPRTLVNLTGDFTSSRIAELIHYRFIKNNQKKVFLKVDWIHEKFADYSRSGISKKLNKLVEDGHIHMEKGKGRHYHKCWFKPSQAVIDAMKGESFEPGKVYYNADIAKVNFEASVVYATITNLLRGGSKYNRNGLTDDGKLELDYQAIVEGAGLNIKQVRKAVNWLVKNKKVESKKLFGNKRLVWMPAEHPVKPGDLRGFHECYDLPSECFPHCLDEDKLPSESYPH